MPLQVIHNNITQVEADAIVNTANPDPAFFRGTDAAIYTAAGREELMAARMAIGPIEPGGLGVTPAFRLHAKYIFHSVSTVWYGGAHGEEAILRACFKNCLEKAGEMGLESIAFPLLGAGNNGFPPEVALEIATECFEEYLAEHDLLILLVLLNPGTVHLARKEFSDLKEYLSEHEARSILEMEYGHRAEAVSRTQEMSDGFIPPEPPDMYMARPGRADRKVGGLKGSGLSDGYMPKTGKLTGFPPKHGHVDEEKLEAFMNGKHITFRDKLFSMIDERGLKDSTVYRGANIDRRLFSRIRTAKVYQPHKSTVLAFAISMRLDLEETQELLASAGFAFSEQNRMDLIVRYCIENRVYNIIRINMCLAEYEAGELGTVPRDEE